MHPLAPDLSKITDDELHTKRAELQNKLSFAYRMGHGDLVGQLQMLLDDYSREVESRNQKMLNDINKNNKNFKDLINITK
jgi:hypothetical protein